MFLQLRIVVVGFQANSAYRGCRPFVATDVMLPQMLLGRPGFVADFAKRWIVAVFVYCTFGMGAEGGFFSFFGAVNYKIVCLVFFKVWRRVNTTRKFTS